MKLALPPYTSLSAAATATFDPRQPLSSRVAATAVDAAATKRASTSGVPCSALRRVAESDCLAGEARCVRATRARSGWQASECHETEKQLGEMYRNVSKCCVQRVAGCGSAQNWPALRRPTERFVTLN
jgi:hypothetical protein